ncbi:MAG: ATP-binding cassette domain-containing protein, partial [Oscillospiraceae bacterium]
MAGVVVSVDQVSMMYNLSRKKEQRLKEYVINFIKGELFFDEFWALTDVSFQVDKGQSLGIVGVNGSGKSTLLKLIAGIMKPSKGTIDTVGSIAPLIELGGGFDRDMTAKENI